MNSHIWIALITAFAGLAHAGDDAILPKVLLLPLDASEVKGEDSAKLQDLARVIFDNLTTELGNIGKYEVVDKNQIKSSSSEVMKSCYDKADNVACAIKLNGSSSYIDYVVGGKLSNNQSHRTWSLSLSSQSVTNGGKAVAVASHMWYGGKDSILEWHGLTVKRLARLLAYRMDRNMAAADSIDNLLKTYPLPTAAVVDTVTKAAIAPPVPMAAAVASMPQPAQVPLAQPVPVTALPAQKSEQAPLWPWIAGGAVVAGGAVAAVLLLGSESSSTSSAPSTTTTLHASW